ncbi:VOC family protein [Mycolicibacterium sp. P1-5]|uniref:VOC family protein n=1 Tax=Mycolicibacterium sp. P1-5 TaxID=2024617 RepID=UPI0011ECD3F5|nr:VOC family protein [Mycolicibacterium sp. P1-5]KAA0107947.1 glyoxalase [Mycolicibacterium sp. P1-5]
MTVTIDEIRVADPAGVWREAGFSVDPDGVCRIGDVRTRLVGRGSGILGWTLRGPVQSGELDGIPTTSSEAIGPEPAMHPNGVAGIDHVVLLSPNLSRTVDALAAIGLQPRRERDAELGGQPMRQIFFRLGSVILEVVGAPDVASDGPSSLWGITFVVDDIDATASFFGDRTLPVKDAVQPGRRITTLRHRDLGMSVRTAMISPPILGA